MKAFLRGLLTIWLFVLLVVFGIIMNVKNILVNTTDSIIKKEIKENVVTIVEELNEEVPKDVITKIEKQVDNNQELKKIMDHYYEQIIEVFGNNGSVQIDVTKELETLIDNSEDILKEYNIAVTEEVKQEMLKSVSSSEINQIVNDSISEMKTNMNGDTKLIIDIYVFATSLTCRVMIIGFILLTILLIALFKKSYFKWLSNFGIASILAGVLLSFTLVSVVTSFLQDIIVVSLTSLSTYGYVLIGLGLLSIILNIVISKLKTNK